MGTAEPDGTFVTTLAGLRELLAEMAEVGEAVVVDGLATRVQQPAGCPKRHAHTVCGAWGGAATPGACGVGCGEQRDIPSPYALVSPYPLGYGGAEEGQATRCRCCAGERARCVKCHRHERGKHTVRPEFTNAMNIQLLASGCHIGLRPPRRL